MRRAFAMKTFGVLVLTMAVWALPSKAMAVPVCGDPNANVLDYNAQGGCTIDGLLFSDFFVDPIPGSPNNVIAMGSGIVNGVVLFQLNPNLGLTTNLEDIHFAIVRSYLKAANRKHGLLLNFAKVTLEVKRVILS